MRQFLLTLFCSFFLSYLAFSQEHETTPPQEQGLDTSLIEESGCSESHTGPFNPGATAFHHIADQNIYNIGTISLPLPCILYAPGHGWSFFSSGKFHIGHHGNGHSAVDRYVLVEGKVRRVVDPNFPEGEVEIGHSPVFKKIKQEDGKYKDVAFICYEDQLYETEDRSTADGGLFGGGITSFYDFSISKNVVSMFLVFLLMGWLFLSVAKSYRERDGKSPKGIQSFIEVIFLFIQDEVAKPFIGKHWEKFTPFLMALFFFILGLNLFGQIPFLGGSNVTGNLAVTMVLAIFTFIVTNINGNKHYWEHVFWMPGVPAWVKTILTPAETLSLFLKPLTLMLRLFANITAGHMAIVIFVGLIYYFAKGDSIGIVGGVALVTAIPTMFMMGIELLVAFIQAFVFTILTASYIGTSTAEAHH